jgi:hypothetical protein
MRVNIKFTSKKDILFKNKLLASFGLSSTSSSRTSDVLNDRKLPPIKHAYTLAVDILIRLVWDCVA